MTGSAKSLIQTNRRKITILGLVAALLFTIIWALLPASQKAVNQYELCRAIYLHHTGAVRRAILAGADVNDTYFPEHYPTKILTKLKLDRNGYEFPYFLLIWPDHSESHDASQPHDEGNEVLKLLLDAGADPNAYYGPATSLSRAIANGYLTSMKLLIEHGANVNAIDVHHDSAIVVAAQYDQPEAILLLAHYGAIIDERDDELTTPAMIAANEGSARALRTLLSLGAQPDLKNIHGDSVVTLAKRRPETQAVLDAFKKATANRTKVPTKKLRN
jgi:Ankyrin repeats (3 copies)